MLTPAAIVGRVAALDIGVTSPAASSGPDAADDMYRRKVLERENQRQELDAQNIEYRPMVWTCFGWPHQATTELIFSIARKVGRKRGGVNASVIARKMHAAISVCIARRAARMSLACWPVRMRDGFADVCAQTAMEHFDDDDALGQAPPAPTVAHFVANAMQRRV